MVVAGIVRSVKYYQGKDELTPGVNMSVRVYFVQNVIFEG
jgi:hypothetical protein